ncbi:DNA polymerase III PolC-type [Roseimaritima multifibrata]|uniref:DNA polymerase III PolC-type n=1 Tax=Roseimaritima multifibrata TaxID=1930274 RepID=A0A517MP73_9BACT|nr:exonuclease domain-containing protein [Roseimaritima multifibrata]QDS96577.1 DNA polymerase III PolC-type [Roseimaritima multifibrata]
MDFTAIDFETANQRPDSACQLAAVVVRNGLITAKHCWLIRPRPLSFSPFNIRIHGIAPEQVANEPDFAGHWPDIAKVLNDTCLVAHNAPFDIKVLNACLQTHQIDSPVFSFTCTRLIAKRTWPAWGRYGLKPISERLDIHFRHHDALEDSIACAKVLLAAAQQRQVTTMETLEDSLCIERGESGPAGYRGACQRKKRRTQRSAKPPTRQNAPLPSPPSAAPSLDFHRLLLRAEMLRTLTGKQVHIRGPFQILQAEQICTLIERLGGLLSTKASNLSEVATAPDDTDVQIVGQNGPADGDPSGPPITWTEEQFLQTLVGR